MVIGEGAAIESYIRSAGVAEAGISIKRDSVVFGQLSHGQNRFNRATADHIFAPVYPVPPNHRAKVSFGQPVGLTARL